MSDAEHPQANGSAAQPRLTPTPARPAEVESPAPHVNPFVYRLVVFVTGLPFFLTGRRLEVHGQEHVPPPGTPLVVAANHESGFDPFLVARALPPGRWLQFMAKKELFMPVIGAVIRAGGSFPVDRTGNDVTAIRTAVRILKGNGTVGIFPEGHRGGQELQGGVALIAAKGRAPILPVGISQQGRRFVIRFSPPISPAGGIKGVTAALAERLRELEQPLPAPEPR